MNRRTFLSAPAAAAGAPQTIVHGIPFEKLRAQYRADPAAPGVQNCNFSPNWITRPSVATPAPWLALVIRPKVLGA